MGLGVIASLWYFSRTLTKSHPLVSLSLFALAPSVVYWGDSLRGTGLGMLFAIMFAAAVWSFVKQPTAIHFTIASLLAVLSVQIVYYNALVVLTIVSSALVLCLQRRDWRNATLLLVVGFLAAVSLIPYSSSIADASQWNMLVQVPHYDLPLFIVRLDETLRPAGPWASYVWIESLGFGLFAAYLVLRRRLSIPWAERGVVAYLLIVIVVLIPVYFGFLKALGYSTSPWYYLVLLAVLAVCIDGLLAIWARSSGERAVRLAFAVVVTSMTLPNALSVMRERRTTIDLAADYVSQIARPSDLIVINQWYDGITFDRYAHTRVNWVTLPDIRFHHFHRYDLLKPYMTEPDQTQPARPVLDRIEQALIGGQRVFIFGEPKFISASSAPKPFPPHRPRERGGLRLCIKRQWSAMMGFYIKQHASKIRVLRSWPEGAVNHFENRPLLMAEGWKP